MHSFIYLVIVSICVPCICNLYLDLMIDVNGVFFSMKVFVLISYVTYVSDVPGAAGCFPLLCTSCAPVLLLGTCVKKRINVLHVFVNLSMPCDS